MDDRRINPANPTAGALMGYRSLPALRMPTSDTPRRAMDMSGGTMGAPVYGAMPSYDRNRFGQPTLAMAPVTPFPDGPLPGDRPASVYDLGFNPDSKPPTVDHNRMGNPRVTYGYAMLDFEGAPQKSAMDSQLVLLYHRNHTVGRPTDDLGDEEMLDSYLGDGVRERQVCCTLPLANAILAQEAMPRNEDEVQTAEDVLNEWTVAGFALSEEGERQGERGNEQYRTRLVNPAIRGSCDAHDIWSGNEVVDKTTKLWLIIKKMPNALDYVLDADGEHRRTFCSQEIAKDANDEGVTPIPFQFVPWASPVLGSPPVDVLEYKDEFGNKALGRAICVGVVLFTARYSGTVQNRLQPWIDASHVPLTPKMEVVAQMRVW